MVKSPKTGAYTYVESIMDPSLVNDWLSKYWEVTIQLCRKVLKKNGNMAYIIGDYDKNDIVKDMNNITKKYFTYIKKKKLSNKNIDFTNHKDTNEIIYFFK